MLSKTLLPLYVVLYPGADADIAEGLLPVAGIAEDLLLVIDMAEGLLLVVDTAEGLLLVLLLDQRPVETPPERALLVLLPVLPVSKGDKSSAMLCYCQTG